ncbi:hypothetical protein NQZ68_003768 [Dissostichus eleginoides]|nr:hypothetical protein NQZ68_003768 [Dissostichus eleginoides]
MALTQVCSRFLPQLFCSKHLEALPILPSQDSQDLSFPMVPGNRSRAEPDKRWREQRARFNSKT